ncbi:MAG: sodium:alanine symporter family protein [candidate division Zixibacteria bacterium]|nr:sodium:alanine symporter family protein [candidate division Zixibacteria bacterium]
MNLFDNFWATAVDIAWGPWLAILLVGSGLYFTFASRFISFRALKHAVDILRGKFDDPDDPGEISHFQALTSALSATIGMGNIAGVAIAISVGGPGSIFWMWVAGLVGMATKFFTCTLAILYRKKDSRGIDQGGPMYFLEVGLGNWAKPLSILFAVCGMIGCLALFQVNQLSGLLATDYGINRVLTGLVCMVAVGVVILGGIVRVGKVTSKIVPFMFILYLVSALYIILSNASVIPDIISSIFTSAFGTEAVIGGGAGIAMKEVIINGIKRAAFSNEAGIGTAPMAHGAAKTKEPVREGLIAMLGPFLDTNIVCTLTALVIISTGVSAADDGVVMTANAFSLVLGDGGRYLLTTVVVLFSVSTMISYSYYSLKCAKYLFGDVVGGYYVYVYLVSLPFAAWLGQDTVVNIIDTCFAIMAIPTLVGALLLSPKVVTHMKDYFQRMRSQHLA